MKKAELKKLVSEYRALKASAKNSKRNEEKMREIEHRYYHETGERLTIT
ncbi:hypothetical protein [Candidatus Nitrosotenuis cloacae]|jgi:hypothetical protein|nr:hypothetical protein [Candidatus Nitrosotenuis cloacae]